LAQLPSFGFVSEDKPEAWCASSARGTPSTSSRAKPFYYHQQSAEFFDTKLMLGLPNNQAAAPLTTATQCSGSEEVTARQYVVDFYRRLPGRPVRLHQALTRRPRHPSSSLPRVSNGPSDLAEGVNHADDARGYARGRDVVVPPTRPGALCPVTTASRTRCTLLVRRAPLPLPPALKQHRLLEVNASSPARSRLSSVAPSSVAAR
jgi:hypothetical protein